MTNKFDAIVKEMEEASEQESDFFKFPTGDTRLRILTDFEQTYSLYEGEYPKAKYVKMLDHYVKPKDGFSVKSSAWAWAIIRDKPDFLKIVQLPYSLVKALGDLKSDPEWEFEDFPMEYDITVGNTGEGGARYSLRGSPKKEPIPAEVFKELEGKKSCQEIVNAILEKQGGKKEAAKSGAAAFQGKEYPDEEINPSDIPF